VFAHDYFSKRSKIGEYDLHFLFFYSFNYTVEDQRFLVPPNPVEGLVVEGCVAEGLGELTEM
jgi:hypothetical protein